MPCFPKTDIVISEVMSSNSDTAVFDVAGSSDWIEVHNTTDRAIDLEGYTIEREDKKGATGTIHGMVLEPGGYAVILATDIKGADAQELPVTGFNLPKTGCRIALKDADGGIAAKAEVPSLKSDMSYCLTDTGYMFCLTPTPGAENKGLMFATLEDSESYEAPEGIVINEATRDFVELYNTSSVPVQLSYFTLSDNAGRPDRWRLPYMELEPGGYFVANFDGRGEYNAPFGISKSEGYIYLSCGGEIYAGISLEGLMDNMSVGLNENGDTVYFADMTPGGPNSDVYAETAEYTDTDSLPLTINELMLKNKTSLIDEDGDRPDWVELYNGTDSAIELSTYYLSDDPEDALKWQIPEGKLEPGEYAIVYLSGKGTGMHTGFRVGEGEALYLTDFSTLKRTSVMFPDESRLDDISYGLKDGEWLFFGKSTPGRENDTHGVTDISNAERLDRYTAYISEISAVGAPRSGDTDWIELGNPSDSEITLEGLFLSDDPTDLKKYALSGSIGPGGYAVVPASDKTRDQAEGTAPFSISGAGDTVYLSDGTGIYDSMDTGALRYGYTSGRAAGDMTGKRVFFSAPTRGEANGTALGAPLNPPEFSENGGIVKSAFKLELTGEGSIYYTTDGSEPTEASNLYSGPISISENTVITAACFSQGRVPSEAVSRTYLFEDPHSVPIVCLSAAPGDFSYVYSSTTRPKGKSDVMERKCYIEYYETDGTLGTAFPGGFRVSGNSTRVYSQKSLSVYLRAGYGQPDVAYPFFDDYPITVFEGFTLRNAGQNIDGTRISDAYAGMVFRDLNLDTSQCRFVAVYVNGKYWGVYDLKESLNEDCLASQHGVDIDTVNVVRRNIQTLSGSNAQVKDVYSKAQSWNTSDDETFEKFCEYVDDDAWIDYVVARALTGDGDLFNQKLWNTEDYTVKWRPIFYDCDFAFAGRGQNTINAYWTGTGVASPDGSLTNMYIPTALKKNAGWRDKFVRRAAVIIKDFKENSLELYDKMTDELRPEIPRQISRWGNPTGGVSGWESKIKNQREVIASRPATVARQIQSSFGVSSEQMQELFEGII